MRRGNDTQGAPSNLFIVAVFLLLCTTATAAGSWSGSITGETRLFPSSPLYPEQHGHNLSLALRAEYLHEWPERNERFMFSPFLRLDQKDYRRTHADIGELYWHKFAPNWELRLGICKVSWGVAESQNLVDIINQSDMVEGPTATAKLGQPMANFTWIQDWGMLDVFVMPKFRERTFAGTRGRFRAPVPIDFDRTQYESGMRDWHTDVAIRYSHYFGALDVALSHFAGTSRDPRYLARAAGITVSPDSPWANLTGGRIDSPYIRLLQRIPGARLLPYYDQIHQTGLELQYIHDRWIFKLEAIHRSGQGRTYTAATGGAEYSFYSVFQSPVDITAVLEYMWDSRGRHALTPFQNDIFFGSRVAFNDIQSTSILLGAIVDARSGATAAGMEASRRLGNDWRIALEARIFANIPSDDILTTARKDDYIQAKLTWFF